MMMEENYYNKLKKLYPLYEKVKSAILFAESFDEEREMYIAPMNQLRSALDHIFKSVDLANKIEDCEYELKEVKEHLERAGYDALDLLTGSLGTSIGKKLQPYDRETLTTLFSGYFTNIKPKIIEIRQNVAKRRIERNIDSDEFFFAYFDEVKELIEINKSVDKMIPSLQEYSDKKVREEHKVGKIIKKQRFWDILTGFVSAALIAILTWLLTK